MKLADSDTVIIIPARMASTRLPGKPLADIAGAPMILRVLRAAEASAVGPAWVATDNDDIAAVVKQNGGTVVMTPSDLASGSDRVYHALGQIDAASDYQRVINLQGDLPTLQPELLRSCADILNDAAVDIATLAAEIRDGHSRNNPNIVKIAATQITDTRLRAHYFSRAPIPYGNGPAYHHIGIYGFQRAALERFVALPPSGLEQSERLEQLRAVEAGMRIDVGVVDDVPIGVDTMADLERVRQHIGR